MGFENYSQIPICFFRKEKAMTYNTEKRRRISELLSVHPDRSYTAEEISEITSPDGSGKSTVYRLISKMVDEGSIRRLSDPKTRRVTYQHVYVACSEHMHLKCKSCGKLIHLDEETSHILERRIMNVAHFSVEDGALLLGKCESCSLGGAV